MGKVGASITFTPLHMNPQLKPTAKGFGIKTTIPKLPRLEWKKHGILRTHPLFGSVVAGMPLLCQTDPKVDAALDAFLNTPEALAIMPKKEDGNTYTATEMRNALKGFGCYDTSIVTVIHTALLNRAAALNGALRNRTAVFDAISGMRGTSKAVRQLAWHYEQVFKAQNGFMQDGKRLQPLYFSEVVADTGTSRILELCDPYVMWNCSTTTLNNGDASSFVSGGSELTNQRIIDLMESGTVVMIAYSRHEPNMFRHPVNGTLHVSFKDLTSYHKVVFSGFQKGDYPLLINDVGNGQRYRVRLSSNLKDLRFTHRDGQGSVTIDPSFHNRPFLIYEGEDKKENPLILFVDHFDGLKIRTD
jgi:hypothetical protein